MSAMKTVQQSWAEDPVQGHRAFMCPGTIDLAIRQAILQCWMMMPRRRRTVEGVEAELRRVFERAIANLKEDAAALSEEPTTARADAAE